jgi:hypothetical protein
MSGHIEVPILIVTTIWLLSISEPEYQMLIKQLALETVKYNVSKLTSFEVAEQ